MLIAKLLSCSLFKHISLDFSAPLQRTATSMITPQVFVSPSGFSNTLEQTGISFTLAGEHENKRKYYYSPTGTGHQRYVIDVGEVLSGFGGGAESVTVIDVEEGMTCEALKGRVAEYEREDDVFDVVSTALLSQYG